MHVARTYARGGRWSLSLSLRVVAVVSGAVLAVVASTSPSQSRAATAAQASLAISPTPDPANASVLFDYPGQRHTNRSISAAENDAIADAVPGSLMVVSVFKITDRELVFDLVNAAETGVHVEVLLNGGNHCTTRTGCPQSVESVLAQGLNMVHQTDPRTWLRTCDGGTLANGEVATSAGHGCIGQGLNHNKFIAVSAQSTAGGPASTLVMQTSTNNTHNQYHHAWNDALQISGQPSVYEDYLRYFRRMVRASTSAAPTSTMYFTPRDGTSADTTTISQHDIETWSFPRALSDDPVADVLNQIPTAHRCRNPISPGTTGPTHTNIYAGIAYIHGRPLLMKQLVALQDAGCSVQILYTTINAQDRAKLTAAGVQIHQACTPADPADLNTSQFLHSKFFLVDGSDTTVGNNRRIVYTGSENWTGTALSNADNRMLRYVEAAPQTSAGHVTSNSPLYDAYLQRWKTINTTIEANGQPTADTCAHASDY